MCRTNFTKNTLKFISIFLFAGLIGTVANNNNEEKLNNKERFVMKYMKAASLISEEDRFKYASEASQFNTVVDIGEHAGFPDNCYINYTQGGPKSVHELQPADIDVVAAIGDSVTAGSGIDAIFIIGSLTQNRGSSWSVGGDGNIVKSKWDDPDPVVTVPNIIQYFKEQSGVPEDLNGWSTGVGLQSRVNARLNQAVIGATAEDLYDQAVTLIDRMKAADINATADRVMDFSFTDSWKLMTLFVGGNDMCAYCEDRERYSPEQYKAHIKRTLDLLLQEVPRMYISIVPMFSITPLTEVSKGRSCDIFQNIICSCATDNSIKEEMDQVAKDYYQVLKDLVGTGDYEHDNFTVVLQDSLVDFAPIRDPETKEVDRSMFAPDCFHPSREGHELLAYILWNTMIKWPIGKKPTRYPIYAERGECNLFGCDNNYQYACPSEEYPYLWTYTNSQNVTGFNYTTTTTTLSPTTSTTTTAPPVDEIGGDETAWIAIGCIIGVVGIFAITAIVCLFVKDKKDDEKSFFA